MEYFKKNGDLLKYLHKHNGLIRFGRCEVKVDMESIDGQKDSLEKFGIDNDTVEAHLIDAIYSSLMKHIFGDAYFKIPCTSDGVYTRTSICENLHSISLTTKDKLETIDKLFTL